jgi:hypothetical protein
MSLQRVSISIPLLDQAVDPESFVPVFHDWIRRGAVEGVLVDVARYAHVHHGPGIMLIGHEGDYSVDLAGGRPALQYTLKRDAPGSPRELVGRALRRLLGAAAEAAAQPGVAFAADELVVEVRDRLRAPNTPETLAVLGPEIAAGLADVLGEVALDSALRDADPRAPLVVSARVSEAALSEAVVSGSGAAAAA